MGESIPVNVCSIGKKSFIEVSAVDPSEIREGVLTATFVDPKRAKTSE